METQQERVERLKKETHDRAVEAVEVLPPLLKSAGWAFVEDHLSKQLKRLETQVLYFEEDKIKELGKTREGLRLEAVAIKIALQLPSDMLSSYKNQLEIEHHRQEKE